MLLNLQTGTCLLRRRLLSPCLFRKALRAEPRLFSCLSLQRPLGSFLKCGPQSPTKHSGTTLSDSLEICTNYFSSYPAINCERHHSSFSFSRNYWKSKLARSIRLYSDKPPVDPEHEELSKRFRNDPEVKDWLKEINEDFGEKHTMDDSSTSSSSESSDSDSSSSDSDSSSSDSSDSDSESESTTESLVESDQGNGATENVKSSVRDLSQFQGLEIIDEEEYEYEDFYETGQDYEEQLPMRELPISLERGTTGVYDLEDLLALLRDENARKVCVIRVPKEHKYVDYMVIVSGKSTRHLKAMSAIVRWIYKQRRIKGDPRTVKIEGELTKDWMAMDLGNIALHLFLPETRATYDLETLWTVGAEFDQVEEEDPFSLYVEEGFDFNSFKQETEEVRQEKETAPPVTMDSKAGWHGSTSQL